MVRSGARSPSSGLGPSAQDRRLLGVFSLGLGLVLFVLILVRGQQAADAGNPQLRNDSYWMLVSPLVFSVFGIQLIRRPARTGRAAAPALAKVMDQSQRANAQLAEDLARNQAQQARELELLRAEARAAQAAAATSQRELVRVREQAAAQLATMEATLRELEHSRGQAALPSPDQAQATCQQLERLERDLDEQLTRARSELALLTDPTALSALRRQVEESLASAQAAQARLEQLSAGRQDQALSLLADLEAWRQQDLQPLRQQADLALAGAQRSQQLLDTLGVQMEQAQQGHGTVARDVAAVLTAAEHAQAEARARADAVQSRLAAAATALDGRLKALERQAELAHQLAADARQQWLQQGTPGAGAAPSTPVPSGYHQACAELGVSPGAPWSEVRACWRRNLLHWHPDQGGDPDLWQRRHAAYQLLEAWTAFASAGGSVPPADGRR